MTLPPEPERTKLPVLRLWDGTEPAVGWGALTSSSCVALGRLSGFLSSASFRKSRNSGDLAEEKYA